MWQKTLPWFFQVLLRTSLQKIINSAGNSIIGKLVKFEGDTFEASKDIPVARLSNEILQAFVRGGRRGGGGTNL